MCKYLVIVETPYGCLNIKAGDEYSNALDKYKEIKEEYKDINCKIKFYNNDISDVQWTAISKNKGFEDAYSNFKKCLIDLVECSISASQNESDLEKQYSEQYHNLELTDTSELTLEEQSKLLLNLKINLNKRRLSKKENSKNYAFHSALKLILSQIQSYEDIINKLENEAAH